MKNAFSHFLLAAVLMAGIVLMPAAVLGVRAMQDTADTAAGAPQRPSDTGALHVEGTRLCGENGQEVILRGVSTHGLTWYPDYVNEKLFRQVSEEWDCNLVRLAAYSEEYCRNEESREETMRLLRRGIDAAVAADMYVLADWHILNDANPNENAEAAAVFFETVSREYGDLPNILYEICNEPNGKTSWADVRAYAEKIIPVIRANDADAVIIIGTPDFDRDLMASVLDPVPYDNLMYALHFYAGSHYDALRAELRMALRNGLPVFVTECGFSESDGDGVTDFENAAEWFSLLEEEHISYAIWSMSDKPESSAMVRPGGLARGKLKEDALTPSGLFARALIRGEDPGSIPVPDVQEKKGFAEKLRTSYYTVGREGLKAVGTWPLFALLSAAAAAAAMFFGIRMSVHTPRDGACLSYDDLIRAGEEKSRAVPDKGVAVRRILIAASIFFTLLYLLWRIVFSVPLQSGPVAVAANLILLFVELFGFAEMLIHYQSMSGMRRHPLPVIPEQEYPEVDIFIATYNEPAGMLRKTINGCLHLKYPDRSKVHIWLCDDNRRPEMRELAGRMGIGYFDRPDNAGAKAGNLNHAMGLTNAPYVVTLDADMIPRSDFLMKTIPYFVDAKERCAKLPEGTCRGLGFLQTPQSFYTPDVFQHTLYAEHRAVNEQDFFYRTIEAAKTSTNSVIYGGSNTVLSRRAIEAAGGFFTGSITEDFATGMLIEAAGYLSLAIPEPLASGQAPQTFREHIRQRTRWGRGVISTAKQLDFLHRAELTPFQKLSYWSSVVYWFSPLKTLIYMISPLLFSVFFIPVFRCTWPELLLYWLPMFIMQELCLRIISGNSISVKWSGIYETVLMPHLLLPILKEAFGISMTTFRVTDKSGASRRKKLDITAMLPFAALALLCVAGIARVLLLIRGIESIGMFILLFWLFRNLYFLVMALFVTDGRDSDDEPVHVRDAEPVTLRSADGDMISGGITTHLTEHSVKFFLDEAEGIRVGAHTLLTIETVDYRAELSGVVTRVERIRGGEQAVCEMEILDFGGFECEYLQILYDRVPTLPQDLRRDFGILPHLWRNIAGRLARQFT